MIFSNSVKKQVSVFFAEILNSYPSPVHYANLRGHHNKASEAVRQYVSLKCKGDKFVEFFARRKNYFLVEDGFISLQKEPLPKRSTIDDVRMSTTTKKAYKRPRTISGTSTQSGDSAQAETTGNVGGSSQAETTGKMETYTHKFFTSYLSRHDQVHVKSMSEDILPKKVKRYLEVHFKKSVHNYFANFSRKYVIDGEGYVRIRPPSRVPSPVKQRGIEASSCTDQISEAKMSPEFKYCVQILDALSFFAHRLEVKKHLHLDMLGGHMTQAPVDLKTFVKDNFSPFRKFFQNAPSVFVFEDGEVCLTEEYYKILSCIRKQVDDVRSYRTSDISVHNNLKHSIAEVLSDVRSKTMLKNNEYFDDLFQTDDECESDERESSGDEDDEEKYSDHEDDYHHREAISSEKRTLSSHIAADLKVSKTKDISATTGRSMDVKIFSSQKPSKVQDISKSEEEHLSSSMHNENEISYTILPIPASKTKTPMPKSEKPTHNTISKSQIECKVAISPIELVLKDMDVPNILMEEKVSESSISSETKSLGRETNTDPDEGSSILHENIFSTVSHEEDLETQFSRFVLIVELFCLDVVENDLYKLNEKAHQYFLDELMKKPLKSCSVEELQESIAHAPPSVSNFLQQYNGTKKLILFLNNFADFRINRKKSDVTISLSENFTGTTLSFVDSCILIFQDCKKYKFYVKELFQFFHILSLHFVGRCPKNQIAEALESFPNCRNYILLFEGNDTLEKTKNFMKSFGIFEFLSDGRVQIHGKGQMLAYLEEMCSRLNTKSDLPSLSHFKCYSGRGSLNEISEKRIIYFDCVSYLNSIEQQIVQAIERDGIRYHQIAQVLPTDLLRKIAYIDNYMEYILKAVGATGRFRLHKGQVVLAEEKRMATSRQNSIDENERTSELASKVAEDETLVKHSTNSKANASEGKNNPDGIKDSSKNEAKLSSTATEKVVAAKASTSRNKSTEARKRTASLSIERHVSDSDKNAATFRFIFTAQLYCLEISEQKYRHSLELNFASLRYFVKTFVEDQSKEHHISTIKRQLGSAPAEVSQFLKVAYKDDTLVSFFENHAEFTVHFPFISLASTCHDAYLLSRQKHKHQLRDVEILDVVNDSYYRLFLFEVFSLLYDLCHFLKNKAHSKFSRLCGIFTSKYPKCLDAVKSCDGENLVENIRNFIKVFDLFELEDENLIRFNSKKYHDDLMTFLENVSNAVSVGRLEKMPVFKLQKDIVYDDLETEVMKLGEYFEKLQNFVSCNLKEKASISYRDLPALFSKELLIETLNTLSMMDFPDTLSIIDALSVHFHLENGCISLKSSIESLYSFETIPHHEYESESDDDSIVILLKNKNDSAEEENSPVTLDNLVEECQITSEIISLGETVADNYTHDGEDVSSQNNGSLNLETQVANVNSYDDTVASAEQASNESIEFLDASKVALNESIGNIHFVDQNRSIDSLSKEKISSIKMIDIKQEQYHKIPYENTCTDENNVSENEDIIYPTIEQSPSNDVISNGSVAPIAGTNIRISISFIPTIRESTSVYTSSSQINEVDTFLKDDSVVLDSNEDFLTGIPDKNVEDIELVSSSSNNISRKKEEMILDSNSMGNTIGPQSSNMELEAVPIEHRPTFAKSSSKSKSVETNSDSLSYVNEETDSLTHLKEPVIDVRNEQKTVNSETCSDAIEKQLIYLGNSKQVSDTHSDEEIKTASPVEKTPENPLQPITAKIILLTQDSSLAQVEIDSRVQNIYFLKSSFSCRDESCCPGCFVHLRIGDSVSCFVPPFEMSHKRMWVAFLVSKEDDDSSSFGDAAEMEAIGRLLDRQTDEKYRHQVHQSESSDFFSEMDEDVCTTTIQRSWSFQSRNNRTDSGKTASSSTQTSVVSSLEATTQTETRVTKDASEQAQVASVFAVTQVELTTTEIGQQTDISGNIKAIAISRDRSSQVEVLSTTDAQIQNVVESAICSTQTFVPCQSDTVVQTMLSGDVKKCTTEINNFSQTDLTGNVKESVPVSISSCQTISTGHIMAMQFHHDST